MLTTIINCVPKRFVDVQSKRFVDCGDVEAITRFPTTTQTVTVNTTSEQINENTGELLVNGSILLQYLKDISRTVNEINENVKSLRTKSDVATEVGLIGQILPEL